MEEFIASLDPEVLLRLVAGNANETKYSVPARMKQKVRAVNAPRSSGATTALFAASLGIPQCKLTDGPAGLHIMGCGATAYPVGMVLAQTWDTSLCKEMGIGIGKELAYYKHRVILGPGMNIHRDPLCGRNFEYYSEDPLITGKMGAAVTIGVQTIPGSCVSIKHFACNNQEEDRGTSNSTVSERALREIYLRGFEICVREAKPKTVMSSYNKLNGVHTSSHYELLTEVLRGEWGFEGLVMTDWNSQSVKPFDLHAGNDLIMGGYRSQFLLAALNGSEPEFAPDGYVKEEVFKVYGGFFKETVQQWNSFEPKADGPDTVSVSVKADVKLNDKINGLVKDGIAEIEQEPGGGKKVIYHGINRGAYLSLGDVQKSAAAVLRLLSQTAIGEGK
jgi:beta-glucosidase